MISPTVNRTVALVRPLFEPRLATAIHQRWGKLVKPPGSLGRLEDLVLHYGLIRGAPLPNLQRKALYVFCADHGIVQEKISAWPQDVTRQMVRTMVHGGACINALCRQNGVEPLIIDMGVKGPVEAGAVDCKVAQGTANFLGGPAMSDDQVNRAVETGILLAEEAATRFDIVALGEMGIGNSTSAAALLSAISGKDAIETTGLGAGIDELGYTRKLATIRGGIQRNKQMTLSPFGALQALGGFEIAAMTGFLLGAAVARLPVVIDGFIGGAAALVARGLASDVLDAAIFSHASSEKAHPLLLNFLGVQPYLDLAMRLGEGTGAVLAIGLLEGALRVYRETMTFDEAMIS